MITSWLQMGACVVVIASGQILMRWGMTGLGSITDAILRPSIWAALVLYGVGMLVWLNVLRTTPLYLAYPLTALCFVLVPVMSSLLLGEPLKPSILLGAAIIILGVVVSYWSEIPKSWLS